MRSSLTLLLFLLATMANAAPFETKAPIAYVIDLSENEVLLAKEIDRPFEPGSMAKLMTAKVVFDALDRGEINVVTTYKVSEDAWRRGGAPSGTAAMFAAPRSEISVIDLLRGVTIQSANDACLILAEGLTKGEPAFVDRMNSAAAKIGLPATRFVNATGLPAPGQSTTARDMVKLATSMLETHQDRLSLYATPEFTWNKITQKNRNPLIGKVDGADGLAIGASEADGFGLIGTVNRRGRRIVFVLQGLPTAESRAKEAKALVDWAYGSFVLRPLFAKGQSIGEASVYGGDRWMVPLIADDAVSALARTDSLDTTTAEIVYRGPLRAPLEAGERVAVLRIARDGNIVETIDLKTAIAVKRGTLLQNAFGSVYQTGLELFYSLWNRF